MLLRLLSLRLPTRMHVAQSGVCNYSSDAASASSSLLSAGQYLPAVLQRPKTISEKAVLLRVASNKSEIIPFDSDNNKLSLDPASDTDDRQRERGDERRGRKSKRPDGWMEGRARGIVVRSPPISLLPCCNSICLPAVPLSPSAALPSRPSASPPPLPPRRN